MPKEKPFKENLPYIYKKSIEDLILYGFVRAISCHVQTLPAAEATRMFLDLFKISEEEYSFQSAYENYKRTKLRFPEICECGTKKVEKENSTGMIGIIEQNAENFMMFGWVIGIKTILPATDSYRAVKLFLSSMGISQNLLFEKYETFKQMTKDYSQLIEL